MAKAAAIKASIRKQINDKIHAVTSGYLEKIPLKDIFDILGQYGIQAVQEDGTPWSGFLVGGAECGSEETSKQVVNFDLIQKDTNEPLNAAVYLSWCKMPSGKYEVVCYLS